MDRAEAIDQVEAKRDASAITGVSNIAYDLMVVLTNKLEAIAAIEEYKIDAAEAGDAEAQAVLERIEQSERDAIDQLRALVVSRLQRK
jgi:hypothetical protein